MLYLFKVVDTPFLKMGFTNGCPWRRVATGFWSNVHPSECCGKLGWENLQLMAVTQGTLEQEAAIKQALPPSLGEFWPEEMAEQILRLMGDPLPLPDKPPAPPEVDRSEEKLPCCTGQSFSCFQCDKVFRRFHHLQQHLQSHGQVKSACGRCGKGIIKRNLKRHQQICS